jgi:hypothetical protein
MPLAPYHFQDSLLGLVQRCIIAAQHEYEDIVLIMMPQYILLWQKSRII